MCGIVGYLGGAPNSLTRVLTAMESIIYRAPDSTGVGIFGCENSPLRARKSVGSVRQLADILLKTPLYADAPRALMGLFDSSGNNVNFENRQIRLLDFENLPHTYHRKLKSGDISYPLFREIIDFDNHEAPRIVPGWPGRPTPLPLPRISSQKALKKLIIDYIEQYDLPLVMIKSAIRDSLFQRMEKRRNEGFVEEKTEHLLAVFDQVFDEALDDEGTPKAPEFERETFWLKQRTVEAMWRFLRQSDVKIPSDYDTDGVRGLFRLMDAVLMSRLPTNPRLTERVEKQFKELWARADEISVDWKTLYMAEKGLNVYGWAAAAAMMYLQKEFASKSRFAGIPSENTQMGQYSVPGKTDPVFLSQLLPPILAQGRWALQSAVTAENGHPFFDDAKQRMIVLNGQFNSDVESEILYFLEDIAKVSLRSENSSEYFALLWGYYFERLYQEKKRFNSVRRQIRQNLESYDVGSQSVDFKIYHKVREKSVKEIDELAFIETARKMIRGGGQMAVAGASLLSPSKILLACHNRPVFIVRRVENGDTMVVSDVNAAMGLFSQKTIRFITQKLKNLRRQFRKFLVDANGARVSGELADIEMERLKQKENELFNHFAVQVYPLDGEEIFARISSFEENGRVNRKIEIRDFDGAPIPDIEPFETILRPPQIQKDFYSSFYETHLNEIPDRMEDILDYYVPDKALAPRLNLKTGFLKRRFGRVFEGMKRLVLIGMGSSHHINLSARRFISEAAPRIETIALKPVETENLFKIISPEKDLVLLTSWSGTTADIVQLANNLQSRNVAFIAVTEKMFSDLGLLGNKSGGVLSTLSGEEITVSGIKSTICTLQCLCLFGVWLCERLHCEQKAMELLKLLHDIPETIKNLLHNETTKKFCEKISMENNRCNVSFVIDALDYSSAAQEAALKLSEASWSSAGKPLDYNDVYTQCLNKDPESTLIIVNATYKPRLSQAVNLMKRLYIEKIPFSVVTVSIREQASVETFCQNRCVFLPEVDPTLQCFVDLAFYYLFSFYFSRARGRSSDFPRNRAKSVTAARNLFETPLSPARELHVIDWEARAISPERLSSEAWLSRDTVWESSAQKYWEKTFYRRIRELVQAAVAKNAVDLLVSSADGGQIKNTVAHLSKALAEEREIIFVPLDRSAKAAAKNITVQFGRFVTNVLRVAGPSDPMDRFPSHSLTFLLDSKAHDEASIQNLGQELPDDCIYVGPTIDNRPTPAGVRSCFLKRPSAFSGSDLLYFTVCLMLIEGMEKTAPKKAKIIKRFFKHGCLLLQNILDNVELKNSIEKAAAANSGYKTALFIGPPGGVGELWTDRFDQFSPIILQDYYFGETAHGPLVTVDPEVDKKFVRLEPGNIMIPKYGKDTVADWEKRFLQGQTTDVFLKRSPDFLQYHSETPFFAEGRWYFPVLKKEYNTTEDNLVILDATSQRGLTRAQDDISTIGARYARMLVISQEAFLNRSEKIFLSKFPISNLISLPPLFENNGVYEPIRGMLLPIVMSCVSIAMAASGRANS